MYFLFLPLPEADDFPPAPSAAGARHQAAGARLKQLGPVIKQLEFVIKHL
jgi:ABC-type transporter Mla subunit MlaD